VCFRDSEEEQVRRWSERGNLLPATQKLSSSFGKQ
jgi:hypothetical protein